MRFPDKNIILLTDSYKLTHHYMYPLGTQYVYSYFEARNGAKFDKTILFGLQAILREHFEGVVLTKEMIDEAEALAAVHFGNPDIFNRQRWDDMLEEHGGRLPLEIKAVDEGTPVPNSNVLFTVCNTDPKYPWLTNAVESLLMHVWYPSTVCSLSYSIKKTMQNFLQKTGTPEGINFMLHDFGFRGATGVEASELGGMGHLVNFMGTDTVPALKAAKKYYDADYSTLAFSVPATEHSIMTSMGQEGEYNITEELIKSYPTGILSCVIDSYNWEKFVRYCGTTLKDDILARDGVFVFRPDSGNPLFVVQKLLVLLAQHFGSTWNDKGYQVLNPKVRIIWGDGIDADGIEGILTMMEEQNWSADNIVFGMGGGLLQKVNRDTQRFAIKCSANCRSGKWYDIQKDPLDATKKSKAGKLALVESEGYGYITEKVPYDDCSDSGLLTPTFKDGVLLKDLKFNQIRENANV